MVISDRNGFEIWIRLQCVCVFVDEKSCDGVLHWLWTSLIALVMFSFLSCSLGPKRLTCCAGHSFCQTTAYLTTVKWLQPNRALTIIQQTWAFAYHSMKMLCIWSGFDLSVGRAPEMPLCCFIWLAGIQE